MNILTVVIITYNHDKWIAQALDGILEQVTDYNFTIKVFDDCSTDDTAKIVTEYVKKYPTRIELRSHKKNLGPKGNFLSALATVDTKYYCLFDGDDYWCDKNKLQLQLDLLEKNQNFVACGHNSYYMRDGKINKDDLVIAKDFQKLNSANVADVIEGRFYCHTSSWVFKNIFLDRKIFNDLQKIKERHDFGDFFNLMFFAQYGDLLYVDKLMSVYRVQQKGVWSSLSEIAKTEVNIDSTILYKKFIDKKYSRNFDVATYYGVKNFLFSLKKQGGFLKIAKYKSLHHYLGYITKNDVETFSKKAGRNFYFWIYKICVFFKI